MILILSSNIIPQGKVYVAYIDGDIDLGLAPYVSRVVSDAEKDNAEAIIFKINTFGGRVDAATQIKERLSLRSSYNSLLITVLFLLVL
jgi:membrane-bound serine protease (ClpP class)